MSQRRPSVIYVSYDGASEPLGLSQVVAYLELLANAADVTLISFEKQEPGRDETARRLEDAGIRWRPIRYHRNPPVVSTAWDVHRGAHAIDEAAAIRRPDLIHARSYVPALMTLRSRAASQAKFLFDIRGFWADERVEGGIWRRGLLYRLAKRWERRFFQRADAIVTLTEASVPQIREWVGTERQTPVSVIPTCAAVDAYAGGAPRPSGPMAIWNGSISTWYDFGLAVRVARELGFGLKVLTREPELARAELDGYPADVRTVSHASVPGELAPGDVGLCLVRPSFSKLASAPTRFAEHLAAGNPVVAAAGVGDLAEIVRLDRVGVVVADEGDESVSRAVRELRELMRDPELVARCRATARRRFSLAGGVERYRAIYESLSSGGDE